MLGNLIPIFDLLDFAAVFRHPAETLLGKHCALDVIPPQRRNVCTMNLRP